MENLQKEIERIRYPHLVDLEITIWRRYLREHGTGYTDFKYDVHVGRGVGPHPGLGKKYQDMAIRLSQKRIDVVGIKGEKAYIIEIKHYAEEGALGQLIGYKTLYEDEYGKGTIDGLILVAEGADQDIIRTAKEQNIQVVIV